MNTITVIKRDGSSKSVESPYTDAAALDRLTAYTRDRQHRLSRNQFALDLVHKSLVGNGLSIKQSRWVHILAVEADSQRNR